MQVCWNERYSLNVAVTVMRSLVIADFQMLITRSSTVGMQPNVMTDINDLRLAKRPGVGNIVSYTHPSPSHLNLLSITWTNINLSIYNKHIPH